MVLEDHWAEKERQEWGRREARIQALLDGMPLSVRMYANGANGRGKPDEVKDGETASESEDGAEQTVLGQVEEKTEAMRIRPAG